MACFLCKVLFDICLYLLTIFGTFWQYLVHSVLKNHATDFALGWVFPTHGVLLRAYSHVAHCKSAAHARFDHWSCEESVDGLTGWS